MTRLRIEIETDELCQLVTYISQGRLKERRLRHLKKRHYLMKIKLSLGILSYPIPFFLCGLSSHMYV